jgi:hypothetical protein
LIGRQVAEENRDPFFSVSEGSRVEQKIEPTLEPVRELEEREFEPHISKYSNDFSFFYGV